MANISPYGISSLGRCWAESARPNFRGGRSEIFKVLRNRFQSCCSKQALRPFTWGRQYVVRQPDILQHASQASVAARNAAWTQPVSLRARRTGRKPPPTQFHGQSRRTVSRFASSRYGRFDGGHQASGGFRSCEGMPLFHLAIDDPEQRRGFHQNICFFELPRPSAIWVLHHKVFACLISAASWFLVVKAV